MLQGKTIKMSALGQVGRVSQKSKNKESEILEAAISMFASRGYRSVSMRDLAKALNITPGALYHYYPDKQSLYLAAFSEADRRSQPAAIEAFEDKNLPPLEQLRKFITRICQRYYEDPEFCMLGQRSLMEYDESLRELLAEKSMKQSFETLEDFLEDFAPEFNCHLLTVLIFGLVGHAFINSSRLRQNFSKHRPDLDRPEVIADHIIKLLQNGILSGHSNM